MKIEIPAWLYELLLIEAAQTDSAIEEIAESAFRNFWQGRINCCDIPQNNLRVFVGLNNKFTRCAGLRHLALKVLKKGQKYTIIILWVRTKTQSMTIFTFQQLFLTFR